MNTSSQPLAALPFLANDDLGKLILRLTLGGALLFHGAHKLMNFAATVDGMGALLASHHLPAFLAYGVFVGEALAPALIVLGLFTRLAGLIVAINMLFAVLLVHSHQIFTLTNHGAWALELQGFYLFGALALVFLGGGRYALGGGR